ncbi:hypothetical protein IU427_08565 [Nocardia beijingensis]|uniref:hypothetical protein n=1 Tax=Nocardia beijingensis TaxID=95162 RepID=UPI001894CDF6|nr:hypothetical protein [Nocardia beijingensis]MBF6465236.1 hypothetical protein [Nocardia beijingensis]
MRSAVIAAFLGATLLTGSSGTAVAGIGLPPLPESGSASSGSAGGLATTGSAGSGSAGGKLLCAATGSAIAILGDAQLGCNMLP